MTMPHSTNTEESSMVTPISCAHTCVLCITAHQVKAAVSVRLLSADNFELTSWLHQSFFYFLIIVKSKDQR